MCSRRRQAGGEVGRGARYSHCQIPANWDNYGKRAGFIRNSEMAEYADACIVFWNGSSKGAKHMIDVAKRKAGMRLITVKVTPITYVMMPE